MPSRFYGLAPCLGPPPEGVRCRCGTHFGIGTSCFRFTRVPRALAGLLEGEKFCGAICARAFVLEALELIESSSAPSVLRDLEEIRVSLRYLLAVMAIQASPRPLDPGSAPRAAAGGLEES